MAPFVLLAMLGIALYLPPVQDLVRGRVATYLQGKIGTPVGIERITLRFPLGVGLHGLYLPDQQGDTLLALGSLKVRVSAMGLLDKRLATGVIQLEDVHAVVRQGADSTFNFDHILQAFASSDSTPADTTASPWRITVDGLALQRIRLEVDLRPSGLALDTWIGELELDDLEPGAEAITASSLAVRDSRIHLRTTPSAPTPDPYPLLEQAYSGPAIALRDLTVEHTLFTMAQRGTADSLWVELPEAQLTVRQLDLAQQHFELERILLDGTRFGMITSASTAPDTTTGAPAWLGQHDGFRFWLRDRRIVVDEMVLKQGRFAMHTEAVRTNARLLDPAHLDLQDIDLVAGPLQASNERVDLQLKDLSFAEKDHRFQAALDLRAAPDTVRIDQGRLTVDGQRIDLALQAAPGDLDRAYRSPRTVPLRAELRSAMDPQVWAHLLSDLGMDRPELRQLRERLEVDLLFAGSAAQVDTALVDIRGAEGSRLRARAQANDLLRLPAAPFDVAVEEVNWGPAFTAVLRPYWPADMPMPHQLNGHLNASSAGDQVQAMIHLKSDLGRISGRLEAAGLQHSLPRSVDAAFDITGLRLDRLLHDTLMGPADLRLTAQASDLDRPQARTGHLELVPTRLRFQGHDLSSLRLNATVHGDSLHALVTSAAEHLSVQLNAHAHWPLNDSLSARFDLDLDRLHLQHMGWMPYPLDVDGHLLGRATITTQGTGRYRLNADGLRLSNPDRSFTFKQFEARAHLAEDTNSVVVQSDGLTLDYRTNIAIDSLLPHTQEKLASFFQPENTYRPVAGERMALKLALPNSAWLTGLVVPDLKAIQLERFDGSYDSDADRLVMDIDMPHLDYAGIQVDHTTLDIQAEGQDLRGRLGVQRIIRDSLSIDGLAFDANSEVGALGTELRIGSGDTSPYRIPLRWTRETGGMTIHVAEGLTLDGQAWTVDPANALHLLKDGLTAEHFRLQQADQVIAMIADTRSTRLDIESLRTGPLINFITTKDSVPFAEGLLNGTAQLPRDARQGPEAALRLTDMRLQGHPLGDLRLDVQSPSALQQIVGIGLTQGKNELTAEARVDRRGEDPNVQAAADIDLQDLSFLQPFTGDQLERLAGALDGTLTFSRRNGRNSLGGDLAFAHVQAFVRPLGSLYRLENERLTFDDKGLHLHDLTLRDSLDNRFILGGHAYTTDLTSYTFDLTLRTERFLLTSAKQGATDLYYGDVVAGIDLAITGTDRNPKVSGGLKVLPGTDLSVILPGSKVELVQHEDVVVFTAGADSLWADSRSDAEVLRDSLRERLSELELDLRVEVDPEARFAVVLDPVTADQATFRGTGDLHLQYDRHGDIRLTGPFTVEEGGYTLEFYGLVKKRFDLVKGSSVTWSGDPLKAAMDIKARYISNSAPYPLVANSNPGLTEDQRNRLQARLPFEVVIGIGGEVQKPDITFGLDLERTYRNSYPQVATELDRLAQSGQADERNKQVFGLLVLNSFIQDEGSGGAPSSSIASSAARNSVNGLLTDQMNKLTGKFIKGVDIQLGVNTYDQVSGSNVYQRTSVDYKVSKRFMNDRLSFEVGGSVGVNEQEQNVSNVSSTRAAQYAILYDLTKDGRFRLRAFHENAFDLYDGEITDSGIALMYTKEIEENQKAREAMRNAARQQNEEQERRQREENDRRRQATDSLHTPTRTEEHERP